MVWFGFEADSGLIFAKLRVAAGIIPQICDFYRHNRPQNAILAVQPNIF